MQVQQDLTTDGLLAKMMLNPDIEGYILFSKDGIVIRSQVKSMNEQQVNNASALLTDYWNVVR